MAVYTVQFTPSGDLLRGNLLCGCQHPREGVSQQQCSDPPAVELDIDGESGNKCYGNRKVPGHASAHGGASLLVLQIADDGRVVADYPSLSGEQDKSPCRVASLALARGMAQP